MVRKSIALAAAALAAAPMAVMREPACSASCCAAGVLTQLWHAHSGLQYSPAAKQKTIAFAMRSLEDMAKVRLRKSYLI